MSKKKIKHLVVIAGPTASGKTELSVLLAKHFSTVVVSADSRQFYKEIAIGTAKPSVEDQNGIPHYFIDSHSLDEEVTSSIYEEEGLSLLEQLFEKHDVVILTGGSGMYIDALCNGLDKIPTSKEIRIELQDELNQHGLLHLLNELEEKDPNYFDVVDKNNPNRIIRALEVIRITGVPYSNLRLNLPTPRNFNIHRYIINHPRETLYNRINLRVDQMIEAGLLEEATSVKHLKHLNSLNTVGYKEFFEYLDGQLSLEEAIEKIKMNTRRYAKRQMTWFRKSPDNNMVNYSNSTQVVGEILTDLKKKMI